MIRNIQFGLHYALMDLWAQFLRRASRLIGEQLTTSILQAKTALLIRSSMISIIYPTQRFVTKFLRKLMKMSEKKKLYFHLIFPTKKF